jgi:hypothetical protein
MPQQGDFYRAPTQSGDTLQPERHCAAPDHSIINQSSKCVQNIGAAICKIGSANDGKSWGVGCLRQILYLPLNSP